ADCKAPTAVLASCVATGIDAAPVVDLTIVRDASIAAAARPMSAALGIDEFDVGDVVIDNADPITEIDLFYDVITISGYSTEGNVEITNQAGADLYAGSVFGNAIGIYAYSMIGDASVDNAADIDAISYYGLADGIFASGENVDVANSGEIEVYGYTWAAGIEAQGADSTVVTNSGDITVSTEEFVSFEYYVFEYYTDGVDYTVNTYEGGSYTRGGYVAGIYVTAGEGGAQVDNSGDITVEGGYHAYGIQVASGGDVVVNNSGDITAGSAGGYGGSDVSYSDPYALPYTYTFSSYSVVYGSQLATGISATANGEGASVAVANSGTIFAEGYYGATGISTAASGIGGTSSVVNTGAIYAIEYGGALGAYGISAFGDSGSTVVNEGMVVAVSGGADATGISSLSFAGNA